MSKYKAIDLNKEIKTIKQMEIDDRLDGMSKIRRCLTDLSGTCMGLASLLCDPGYMNDFSIEEIKEFFDIVRENAVLFMEITLEKAGKPKNKEKLSYVN